MPAQLIDRVTSLWAMLMNRPRLVVSVLIVCMCLLVGSTWRYFSVTWDEPEHLAAGMQLLDEDVYIYDVQHPPLARLAMALGPYLAGARAFNEPGPSGEQSGRDLLYKTGHYGEYLFLARAGMLPFLALLLWSTWLWSKYLFGPRTALLATLLVATTPPLLGHAGVAALDIPGTATCTLALYCLMRWFETQSWQAAVWCGVAAGMAIATKLSALPFIAVVGAAWLPCWWLSRNRVPANAPAPTSLGRWSGQCITILLVMFFCAALTYTIEFRRFSTALSSTSGWAYLVGASGWAHDVLQAIGHVVPLPVGLGRLILSIQALLKHNHEGHLSYLMGRFSETGFREFYVVALAVRTPLPLLLLGTAGLVALPLRARQQGWTVAAPSIAFIVLLAFCSFYSRINIGMRHVFTLFPLLCMAGAAFTAMLWKRYRQPALRAVLVALIGWQISLLYSAYPDYLPYFNMFAGKHPEHILIDSDLDWGQDVERLRDRLNELHVTKFWFVYRGTIDVIGEGLPGVLMAQPFHPVTGWVAASVYARDTVSQGEAFGWLKAYTPRERIGKSIDLYYIPEPTSEAASGSLPGLESAQSHKTP